MRVLTHTHASVMAVFTTSQTEQKCPSFSAHTHINTHTMYRTGRQPEIIQHHSDDSDDDGDIVAMSHMTNEDADADADSTSDEHPYQMEEDVEEGEEEEEQAVERHYSVTDDAQLDILEQRAANAAADKSLHYMEYLGKLHDNYMHWQQKLLIVEEEVDGGQEEGEDVEDVIRSRRAELRKSFVRMRQARNTVTEESSVCNETFWSQWIQEEQYWWLLHAGFGDEETSKKLHGVVRSLSHSEVKTLFDRAVQECPCMPAVWHMYCEFMITAAAVSSAQQPIEDSVSSDGAAQFDLQAIRQVFDRAIDACGHHMSQCQTLWDLYRGWISTAATDEEESVKALFNSGKDDIVRSLFQRQLAIPHFDIDRTWSLYREWEKDENHVAEMELVYARGVHLMRDRVEYETLLAELEEKKEEDNSAQKQVHDQELQIWMRYIEYEMKNDDLKRTLSLYERAVQECISSVALWRSYLGYLEELADKQQPAVADDLILSVCKRAVKNCPWSVALWIRFLVNQEFLGGDFGTMQQIFNKAQQMGALKKPSDYEEFFMVYCCYLKRLAETAPEGEQIRAELRDTLQSCSEQLISFFPDHDFQCSVQRLWAHVEVTLLQNIDGARQVLEQYTIAPFGSKYAKHWIHYATFELMFIRDLAVVRALYQRGLNTLKNSNQVNQLGHHWIEFERVWGNHISCVHYASKTIEQRVADIAVKKDGKGRDDRRKEKKRERKERPKKVEKDANKAKTQDNKKRKRREDEEHQKVKKPKVQDAVEGANGRTAKQTEQEQSEQVVKDGDLTLFLWNLPYTLEHDALKKIFEDAGCTVEKIRIVKDKRGAPRGFAYMDLCDKESVRHALQLDSRKISGRTMRVSVSRPPKSDEDRESMKQLAKKEISERAEKETVNTAPMRRRKRGGMMMVPRSVARKQQTQSSTQPEQQQQKEPLSNVDFKAFLLKK